MGPSSPSRRMSKKHDQKKASERRVIEEYLKVRGVSYIEISDGESPDFTVKLVDGFQHRFELVELTDPNERATTGTWYKVEKKLKASSQDILGEKYAPEFAVEFSDARIACDLTHNGNRIERAFERFLMGFVSDPEKYKRFVGDPNSGNSDTEKTILVSRIIGFSRPQLYPIGLGFWSDETYTALTGKFKKPYAICPDVTIVAFWKPKFVPGNPSEVKAKLSKIVQTAPNKDELRVVGFDMENRKIFFEHPLTSP